MNYIEDISKKTDVKEIKDYQIRKNSPMLVTNFLAIITQFLQISINDIMMLLCQRMSLRPNIDKFLLRSK